MIARLAALVLLLLGLLPIANWIPGGHAAPWYADRLDGWGSGGAIVLGIAVIAWILLRGRPQLWPAGAWGSVARAWHRADWAADLGLALAAFGLYAAVSRLVLSASPLLIDEIIQLYQARTFAAGEFWRAAPAYPEFTGAMHLIDWGGKVYGQFPAGGPAMLALGTLAHAEWLVGPCFAAIGLFAFARILRRIEGRTGTAFAALLLYGFAPFTVFLSASMMNHVTTVTWLLLGCWALAAATATAAPRVGLAFLVGLAFAGAATIRPLDGAVFAVPAGVWLLGRARRGGGHLAALVASGIGIALPLLVLGFVNAAQTGDPLRFGYIEMWGRSHELGFHEAPWGFPHTPARGLELVNLYLLRLQTYFLETPVPALLFATGALALVRRVSPFDRWALVACGGILLAYFGYWHDGFYLGPRFILPITPWLALWTARFPAELAERTPSLPLRRAVLVAGLAALAIGGTQLLPLRARQYRNGMLSMRLDADAAAAAQGVTGAIVLVRESWGAQVIARMWGLGVSRVEAEQLYRSVDLCRLDEAVAKVEASGGGATALARVVARARADSAKLIPLRVSVDTTGRVMPGSTLTPTCTRRVLEDRAGYTLFPPLLLARDTSIRYIRDLHARDTLLLNAAPGRPVWLVTRATDVGSPLRFERVNLDSARAEWRASGGPP
jgi:hypothetical protein